MMSERDALERFGSTLMHKARDANVPRSPTSLPSPRRLQRGASETISDGLTGEVHSDSGWFRRFSAFGGSRQLPLWATHWF
jgi:hypothetical protein